jgi:hypothetical protein
MMLWVKLGFGRKLLGVILRPGSRDGTMRILIVLALSVPLAGCFSLTASKPIPEWAMQPQADVTVEPAVRPQRAATAPREPVRVARQSAGTATDAPISVRAAGLTHSAVRKRPTALTEETPRDVTAFSAEWHAREEARDIQLRRSMNNICRGC